MLREAVEILGNRVAVRPERLGNVLHREPRRGQDNGFRPPPGARSKVSRQLLVKLAKFPRCGRVPVGRAGHGCTSEQTPW